MNAGLDRGLKILEHLAAHPGGAPLSMIADDLNVPRSVCHRLLADLRERGYVCQPREHGDYALTAKVASLGLSYLSNTGIVDIAEPVIERLAQLSGELVRLSIVDNDRLTWVAKAQGGRKGARYDPDMGMDARLSCTASGYAWLLTLSDERALELVSRQGFGSPKQYGPRAPTTVRALLARLHDARECGFAKIDEVFAPGMSALAAPVQRSPRPAIGVISIAGPRLRLTAERMDQLAPALLAAASELAMIGDRSVLIGKPALGRG